MSKRPNLPLEVMAVMREEWSETTGIMLAVTIGFMLEGTGRKSVTLDLTEVASFVEKFDIDRHYWNDAVSDRAMLTITIKERE